MVSLMALERGPLTEQDVLEFLADGYTSAEIGEEWGVTPHTVVNRINRMKIRYGAKTHTEVVVKAIKSGDLDIGMRVVVEVVQESLDEQEAKRLGYNLDRT